MEPDVTQTAVFFKLWTWADAHRKQILWATMLAAAAAFVAGFIFWRQGQTRDAANDALSKTIIAGLMTGQLPPPQAFTKVAADYPDTTAGSRAILMAGVRFFSVTNFAEARTQFEKYLRDSPSGPFAGGARFGIASSLDAQGNTTEAINAYKEIVERHPTDFTVPQAKLALARAYEAQGNLDQAHNYYSEIAKQEFGSVGMEADYHLQALDRQASAPAPVPAPAPTPASTNGSASNLTHP